MNVVRFRVEVDSGDRVDAVAGEVEERLIVLDPVGEVQAAPEEPRDIGQIVTAVAGAVAIAKGGTALVAQLRELVAGLKKLVGEIDGLRRVVIEVGSREVEVGEIGDEDIAELAASAS